MRNAVQLFSCNYILHMRKGNRAFISSCDRSWVKMADRFGSRGYSLKTKLGDRMIKQLLNSVIARYRDLSVSRRSIICLSLRLRQILDLFATDKITIFCSTSSNNCYFLFLKPRLGDFLSTRLCAYKLYLLEILYWNHTMLIHYLMAQNVSLGCLQEWMKKISV